MFHATTNDRLCRFFTRLGLLLTMPFAVAFTPATLYVPEYPGNHNTTEREGTNELIAVTHAVGSALDPATGLPDPRSAPKHTPVVVTKLVDQSTPGFYRALTEGLMLDEVIIEFYGPPQNGRDVVIFSIEMYRARIVSIEVEHDSEQYPESNGIRERVAFVYEQITWTFQGTGESTQTTWIPAP